MSGPDRLRRTYRLRFHEGERARLEVTWEALCTHFFQRWVAEDATVLDLAAGSGLFIRNIKAHRKIAVDLNPDVAQLAHYGIEVVQCAADALPADLGEQVDVVFTSNFLEHLGDKDELMDVLDAARGVLRPGGRILVLQPNLRYVGAAYWDYLDHRLPLTDKSLAEALQVAGFTLERLVPRFLPYTAKSRLSAFARLTPLYVRFPPAWRLFGKQSFAVASKPDGA